MAGASRLRKTLALGNFLGPVSILLVEDAAGCAAHSIKAFRQIDSSAFLCKKLERGQVITCGCPAVTVSTASLAGYLLAGDA
jgi:hypothetical protein